MSNPYGPNQPSQWGGQQASNGQNPVGAQGGAIYGTPSAQQQPSGAMGTGYGHAQPTVNQQAQPGYYQAPSPMPQVQPVGAPSYGSVGTMPPPQKSHAGLIIGIVVAILVILLMIVFAAIATSNRPRSTGQAPATGAPATGAPTDSSSGSSSGTSSGSGHGASKPRDKNGNDPLTDDEETNVFDQCKHSLSQSAASGNITDWTISRDGKTDKGNLQYVLKGTFEGTINSGKSGTFAFTCNAVQDLSSGQFVATATFDTK